MRLRCEYVALTACFGLLLPSDAVAQHVVEGRVLSAASGAPLRDVAVRVQGEDVLVGTDSLGAFRFELPEARPGVALRLEVIGYQPFERTWILPLDEPLTIGLQRDVIELDGIDVETRLPILERMHARLRGGGDRSFRTADRWQLRRFPHQEADIYDFLPDMTVATGVMACEECMMMNGIMRARFFMDDLEVDYDEFRSYTVAEICRVEVIREIPNPGPNFDMVEAEGGVHAYTCDFMHEVERGQRPMSPWLWPWDSMLGDPRELLDRRGGGPGGGPGL